MRPDRSGSPVGVSPLATCEQGIPAFIDEGIIGRRHKPVKLSISGFPEETRSSIRR